MKTVSVPAPACAAYCSTEYVLEFLQFLISIEWKQFVPDTVHVLSKYKVSTRYKQLYRFGLFLLSSSGFSSKMALLHSPG